MRALVTKATRKRTSGEGWPRKVTFGRVSVSVYRRSIPSGGFGYMVANYAGGKRRFDSYPTEAEVLEAAQRLARLLSERQVVAASITNPQAADYAAAGLGDDVEVEVAVHMGGVWGLSTGER